MCRCLDNKLSQQQPFQQHALDIYGDTTLEDTGMADSSKVYTNSGRVKEKRKFQSLEKTFGITEKTWLGLCRRCSFIPKIRPEHRHKHEMFLEMLPVSNSEWLSPLLLFLRPVSERNVLPGEVFQLTTVESFHSATHSCVTSVCRRLGNKLFVQQPFRQHVFNI